MIGRIAIDGHQYEIEQLDRRVTLRRLKPAGKQPMRADGSLLYNFATGGWDIAAIGRVVRRGEREGLFDQAADDT